MKLFRDAADWGSGGNQDKGSGKLSALEILEKHKPAYFAMTEDQIIAAMEEYKAQEPKEVILLDRERVKQYVQDRCSISDRTILEFIKLANQWLQSQQPTVEDKESRLYKDWKESMDVNANLRQQMVDLNNQLQKALKAPSAGVSKEQLKDWTYMCSEHRTSFNRWCVGKNINALDLAQNEYELFVKSKNFFSLPSFE